MNTIRLVGQTITSVDYATTKLFNFNPDMVQAACEQFLAAGITEIEIPQGVIDPNNEFSDTTGLDEKILKQTINQMPEETTLIGSYLGGPNLGKDNSAYLEKQKRTLDHLIAFFPDFKYVAMHPPVPGYDTPDVVKGCVEVYAKLAEHAAAQRPGFQICLHNHYDSSCETADQVKLFLNEIASVNLPSLRWGPDTGHCHGMKDQYLEILDQFAHLIGDYFHIKARVEAFDQLHSGDKYRKDRDIWGNKAEFGKGLYGGFVNAADPEIHTPLAEVFNIIKEKAQPVDGIVRGAMEIDIPRQHPRLEILCEVLYMKEVHGIETNMALSNDEIISRVFAGKGA